MREFKFISKFSYNKKHLPKMLLAHLLEPVIAGSRVTLPLPVFDILQSYISEGNIPSVSLAAGAALLASNIVLPKMHDYLIENVRNNVQKDITVDMVGQIYDRALNAQVGAPTGTVAVITSKNYGNVGDVMPKSYSLLIDTLEVLGMSYLLTSWYGLPGIVPTLGLGAYIAASMRLERKTEQLKQENSMQKVVGFTSLLGAVNNYKTAHQFGNTAFEVKNLDKVLQPPADSFTKLDRAKNINGVILSSLKHLPMLFLVCFMVAQESGISDVMQLFLGLYYLMRFSNILDPMSNNLNALSNGLSDTTVMIDYLESKSDLPDPEVPKSLSLNSAPSISFENVSFAYPDDKDKKVISDISFEIKPGHKVVLMGPTGCGKSTLLQLLQRFYACEGSIKINGIDITEVTKKDLRSALAVVSQDTTLMQGSVYSNIEYGAASSDSKQDNQNVFEAAKFAKLNFDKERFFKPLTQGGADFSGGEKQRINIARFLLRTHNNPNAKVFIMDEPTAALDQKTSGELCATLDQLADFGTVLTVTHDPTIAANADQILYFDNGKILEKGTFSELMERKGEFYNQILEQCKKLNIDVDSIKPSKIREKNSNGEFSKWLNESHQSGIKLRK